MRDFPDGVHVTRIREALWQRPELGRASVMVGAGFSRNAVPNGSTTPAFPTWPRLAELFVNKLYPPGSLSEDARSKILRQSGATSSALRLAEEFEAAFGRDSLDSLLLSSIPDESHRPGKLHHMLLELPWADVLSTNYDTLLEREAALVAYRKYDVVRTTADIPAAMRPRIVKLNGSFPSTRPFIITEEDFRTYPTRFAPFVNLAQQVAMETILCLIGFSGDDPNFLNWTGWVRDNLGASSPRIYLIGILQLSSAQKELLRRRNVIPVDLAPLFPIAEPVDTAVRHRRSLEWLFLTLAINEDAIQLDWPDRPSSQTVKKFPNLPPLLETKADKPKVDAFPAAQGKTPLELINEVLPSWQNDREQYPGWLIAPASNRELLWHSTTSWITPILSKIASVPLTSRFQFLYELNWRWEKCLLPIDPLLEAAIAEAVNLTDPFAGSITPEIPNSQPEEPSRRSPDPTVRRTIWVDLVFALIRSAREDQDAVRFKRWRDRLTKIDAGQPGIHSRLRYEECLWYLGRLDYDSVREVLGGWNAEMGDPFWEIRRAAVLAEIGETREATRAAQAGLAGIRERIRPDGRDVTLPSREGWAMMLVSGLFFFGKTRGQNQQQTEFDPRWDRLAASKCDPRADWRILGSILEGIRPTRKPRITETRELDGAAHREVRFGSDEIGPKLIPAYQLIRMTEEAAYPPGCLNVSLSGRSLRNACKWVESASPALALSNLLRIGDGEDIRKYLSPERVALLRPEEFDGLRDLIEGALKSAVSHAGNGANAGNIDGTQEKYARITTAMISALSAIAIRFSPDQLENSLKLAMSFYSSPFFRLSFPLHTELRNLFKVLLESVPDDTVARNLLALISLPIPEIEGFTVSSVHSADWPEPMQYLEEKRGLAESQPPDEVRWHREINNLEQAVRMGSPTARWRAALRLWKLQQIGLLNKSEVDEFGQALWSKTDAKTGLPSETQWHDFMFLYLPSPNPPQVREILRHACTHGELEDLSRMVPAPDGSDRMEISIGLPEKELQTLLGATHHRGQKPFGSNLGIDWTSDEAYAIFGKIERWWRRDGQRVAARHESTPRKLFPPLPQRLQLVAAVLGRIVLPNVTRKDARYVALEKFLSEIGAVEPLVHALVPFSIGNPRSKLKTVTSQLRKGIVSNNPEDVEAAMQGVVNWLWGMKYYKFPKMPGDLLREIGNFISARRQRGLLSAIERATQIVTQIPECANGAFLNSLTIGLEYLLEETSYTLEEGDTNRTVPIKEIAIYRRACGKLAVAMAVIRPTDPVCLKWQKAISADPLSYVRDSFPRKDQKDNPDGEPQKLPARRRRK